MTFVVAVLAACSFFLSIRYQMKARISENRDAAENVPADEDNDEQILPHS